MPQPRERSRAELNHSTWGYSAAISLLLSKTAPLYAHLAHLRHFGAFFHRSTPGALPFTSPQIEMPPDSRPLLQHLNESRDTVRYTSLLSGLKIVCLWFYVKSW